VQQNFWLLGSEGISSLRPEFMSMPLAALFNTNSVYDLTRLYKTLEEFVEVDKLNAPDNVRVITTAINVRTSAGTNFDNKRLQEQQQRFTFDHVVASASWPPNFPMVKIGGEHFWDGGIFANMPFAPAINALEEVEPDNPEIERELLVIDLIPMLGEVPRNVMESSARSTMLFYANKFELDRKFFNKINSLIDLAAQLNEDLPPDSPARQMEAFKKLQRYKKIDRFTIFGESGLGARGAATDYTEATIKSRIEAGYQDAKAQLAFNNEL
jgi:NTE family protein